MFRVTLVFFFCASCLLYNPCKAENFVKEAVSIVISFKTMYKTGCITLHTLEHMAYINRNIQMGKYLSKNEVSIVYQNKGMARYSVKTDMCARNRPLIVVNYGISFLQQIRNITKLSSYPRWLIFLDAGSPSLDEIFYDVDVPFDCEFVVVESRDTDKVELTEVYRITEGGPLMKDHYGTWGPQGLKINTKYLYERRNNLKGAVVKVAVDVLAITKLNTACDFETRIDFKQYMMCVWLIIQHRLNFTTDFVPNAEKIPYRWGLRLNNGSWSGMIGMMERNEVDFGIADFSMTEMRIVSVDFLMPTVPVSIQMYIRDVGNERYGAWNIFVSPFSSNLWYAIIGSIVTLGIIISTMQRFTRLHIIEETHGQPTTDDAVPYRVTESILQVLGLYCQQGNDETPKSSSARILYLMAGVTSVVVLAAYSAALISSLANQKRDLPFETLQGFFDDGTYKLGILEGTVVADLFFNSSDPLLKQIYMKHVLGNEEKIFYTNEEFEAICGGNIAFLTTRDIVELYTNLSCNTVVLSESFLKNWMSLTSRKGSPYSNLINYNLHQLRDSGVLSRLLHLAWPKVVRAMQNENSLINVTFTDVLPSLVIFVTGIGLSIFMFIAEHFNSHTSENCYSKMHKKWHNKNVTGSQRRRSVYYFDKY